jgi:serine/threonine protein kinase
MALANNKNSQIIRDYLLKEKLGTGSYGVVYKVIKKGVKQYYVLKQISLFNMNKAQIEEVKNEAKILYSLNSSFIVKYEDSFVDNNNLIIIMEYCDGGDLSNYLNIQMKSGKAMNEEKIWKFFIQICLGLAYIHSKKILHRDLKTLNIFLTKDEKVKIGDLGVAKVLSQTNFAKTFVGTPYYLSPEICEEKPYNEKSDVWALGCILYEMATFKHPFNASNQGALIIKILKGKYDPISSKDYSSELRKMVDLLLEKNHFRRPPVEDIIKNPIFLTKAKNLNILETVLSSCSSLGIVLDNYLINVNQSNSNNLNNDPQSNVYNKKVIPISMAQPAAEKKRSPSDKEMNIQNAVKNVKLEFNQNSGQPVQQQLLPQQVKVIPSEDPSKKFIQMNIPRNYKKQLQENRNKKEMHIKRDNMVKI